MRRIAVIAELKPGTADEAARLVAEGPPFDPGSMGFERHAVYVSGDHVVFVFEGGRIDQLMQAVVKNARNVGAFKTWEPLLEGIPRVAKEAYSWQRGDESDKAA